MPARISSVSAAASQPNEYVSEDSGLPFPPSTCRPGQPNFTVHGSRASASLTGPRFAMEKITMMIRYGEYALSTSTPVSGRTAVAVLPVGEETAGEEPGPAGGSPGDSSG